MENRILVIDDDRELCGLLEEYTGCRGVCGGVGPYRAQGAEQGSQGNYALIVLDVSCPA